MGALPYFGVPFMRNKAFFNRPDQLMWLESSLIPSSGPSNISEAALLGTGGCGKTQLAIEFAHLHQNDYGAIFWLRAATKLDLVASCTEHARSLGLIEQDELPREEEVKSVLTKWLLQVSKKETPIKWLLIFDNLDDSDGLPSFWPLGGMGSVIVTTRNQKISEKFPAQQVPIFSEEESRQFLLAGPSGDHGGAHDATEASALSNISQRLGHLPLALDFIRKYTHHAGLSFDQFTRRYPDFDREFVFSSRDVKQRDEYYVTRLATTFTLSLKDMMENTRQLADLLAFFQPDYIPVALFEGHSDDIPCGPDVTAELPLLSKWTQRNWNDPQAFDESIAELIQMSLATRHPMTEVISIHRLIQRAVLNAMSTDRRMDVFNQAVFLLNAKFPQQDDCQLMYEWWQTCEKYASHVSNVLGLYKEFRRELGYPIQLCEVVRRCAWYLYERYQFQEARCMTEDALAICVEAANADQGIGYSKDLYLPRLTADLYSTLGSIEYEVSGTGFGMSWMQRAFDIRRALCDKYNSSVDLCTLRASENNMALALMADNKASVALPRMESVYRAAASEGPIHEGNWTQAMNLSICYQLVGQNEPAMAMSDVAIRAITESMGKDNLSMAFAQFCRGTLLESMGRYDEAFDAFAGCLEVRQRAMPNHLDTAYVCHKLGMLVQRRQEWDASATFLARALGIFGDMGILTLAAARTAYPLSLALVQLGRGAEGSGLRARVEESLARNHKEDQAKKAQYSESFFDQFVLFKFR